MIVAFTGHRPDKLGSFASNNPVKDRVVAALTKRLKELQDEGPLLAFTGMALGVDQWAAQACLSLDICYEAAIPFKGQELRWPAESQGVYRFLLDQAEKVHVVCEGEYAPWKMQKRNEWLVDHADRLLAVWDGSDGGTANCVRYAWEKERTVERLEW